MTTEKHCSWCSTLFQGPERLETAISAIFQPSNKAWFCLKIVLFCFFWYLWPCLTLLSLFFLGGWGGGGSCCEQPTGRNISRRQTVARGNQCFLSLRNDHQRREVPPLLDGCIFHPQKTCKPAEVLSLAFGNPENSRSEIFYGVEKEWKFSFLWKFSVFFG